MSSFVNEATDERALVAAAQAGDERAFRELVEPYARALEVHCYRMLGSLHDAEDIAQETLLRAWRSSIASNAGVRSHLALPDRNERLPGRARAPAASRRAGRRSIPDERRADAVSPLVDPAARYALREGMELAFLRRYSACPAGSGRADPARRTRVDRYRGRRAPGLHGRRGQQRATARPRDDRARAPRSDGESRPKVERELLRRYVDAWERADMDDLVALLREDAVLSMPPQPASSGQTRSERSSRACAAGTDGFPPPRSASTASRR